MVLHEHPKDQARVAGLADSRGNGNWLASSMQSMSSEPGWSSMAMRGVAIGAIGVVLCNREVFAIPGTLAPGYHTKGAFNTKKSHHP
jgi:hypothetical protein